MDIRKREWRKVGRKVEFVDSAPFGFICSFVLASPDSRFPTSDSHLPSFNVPTPIPSRFWVWRVHCTVLQRNVPSSVGKTCWMLEVGYGNINRSSVEVQETSLYDSQLKSPEKESVWNIKKISFINCTGKKKYIKDVYNYFFFGTSIEMYLCMWN